MKGHLGGFGSREGVTSGVFGGAKGSPVRFSVGRKGHLRVFGGSERYTSAWYFDVGIRPGGDSEGRWSVWSESAVLSGALYFERVTGFWCWPVRLSVSFLFQHEQVAK